MPLSIGMFLTGENEGGEVKLQPNEQGELPQATENRGINRGIKREREGGDEIEGTAIQSREKTRKKIRG